jgi:hypothetical protein
MPDVWMLHEEEGPDFGGFLPFEEMVDTHFLLCFKFSQ